MARLPELIAPPIQPVHWQDRPNQPLDLGVHSAEYKVHSGVKQFKLNVQMTFSPKQRLEFAIPSDALSLPDIFGQFGAKRFESLKWTATAKEIDVFPISSGDHGIILHPRIEPTSPQKTTTGLVAAVLDVFNFPDFSSDQDYGLLTQVPLGKNWQRLARQTLSAGGWTITIAGLPGTSANCKALADTGGMITTHVMKFEREDHATFSSSELEQIISIVREFLSFAVGKWIGLGPTVAYDENGCNKWESWGLPLAASDSWHPSHSWLDLHHGDVLSAVFPRFYARFSDPLWKDALPKAIYWYIRANSGGSAMGQDTGLIIAQAALELLAWTYCVRDRSMVSEHAFGRKGLSATDKLRLMASALDIPMAIPSFLKTLTARPGRGYSNIAEAITSIRNSLVHPSEIPIRPPSPYYECWNLAMWFIELSILQICGATGSYSNRLAAPPRWTGQVEPLPWMKP